jgi:hypothetical protein
MLKTFWREGSGGVLDLLRFLLFSPRRWLSGTFDS